MASLKQTAQDYESPLTLNIADLSSVPIDEVEILEGENTNNDGEKFQYKFFILDKKEYRVPNSVLEEIKKILNLKPDVKHVKVEKSGSGLATRYKVEVVE